MNKILLRDNSEWVEGMEVFRYELNTETLELTLISGIPILAEISFPNSKGYFPSFYEFNFDNLATQKTEPTDFYYPDKQAALFDVIKEMDSLKLSFSKKIEQAQQGIAKLNQILRDHELKDYWHNELDLRLGFGMLVKSSTANFMRYGVLRQDDDGFYVEYGNNKLRFSPADITAIFNYYIEVSDYWISQ